MESHGEIPRKKIKEENIKIMPKRSTMSLNDLDITSFNTPHDSVASTGYTIKHKGKSASIATDIGTFTEEILRNIRESEVILLESNHDVQMVKFGPYPYELKKEGYLVRLDIYLMKIAEKLSLI